MGKRGPKNRWWEPKRPKRGESAYQTRLQTKIAETNTDITQRVIENPDFDGPYTPMQAKILRRESHLGFPLAEHLYVKGCTIDQILEWVPDLTRTWLYKELRGLGLMRPISVKKSVPDEEIEQMVEAYLDKVEPTL